MRVQLVTKDGVIENTQVQYIVCEDNGGGRYTISPKDHSLIVEPAGYDGYPHEIKVITENNRRQILSGINQLEKLLYNLKQLV